MISIGRIVWSFPKMIRRLKGRASAHSQRCLLFAVTMSMRFVLYLYLRLSLDVSVSPFLGRRHDGKVGRGRGQGQGRTLRLDGHAYFGG